MDLPWAAIGAIVFWAVLLPMARRRFPSLGGPAPALVKWTAISLVVLIGVGMVLLTLSYR